MLYRFIAAEEYQSHISLYFLYVLSVLILLFNLYPKFPLGNFENFEYRNELGDPSARTDCISTESQRHVVPEIILASWHEGNLHKPQTAPVFLTVCMCVCVCVCVCLILT